METAIRKYYMSRQIWEKERFWASNLNKLHFPTARIICSSSDPSELWIDFEWVDGRSSTLEDVDSIYAVLQTFSSLGTKIIKEFPIPNYIVRQEKWTLEDWLKEYLLLFQSNSTFWDMYTYQWNHQQYGVIHRDPHYFNWIVSKDTIFLLDFGLVSYGPILYDIAYVWVNECKKNAYQEEKAILLREWVMKSIPSQSFVFFCLFFSIMKNYADYYQGKEDWKAQNRCKEWIDSEVIHGLINECVKFHSNNGDKSIHY
ncbi:aminoglycoside phosphotransferase family protein [Mangrovibacillus cuniculi]|uniref:Aminoglycoside phosphotransferase family protein n=1 Tax=Mangrovibacillus cuniculi TaxID=2593652 RepID=A0A7S8C9W0_9BACI|nr:aminoglycoside phosphotransferase family protein [Mangrovibacillus cuniculi]QPC45941.1 aminoglycoside phosphotransferase family protein [Mangrovibacillus cuniculi]